MILAGYYWWKSIRLILSSIFVYLQEEVQEVYCALGFYKTYETFELDGHKNYVRDFKQSSDFINVRPQKVLIYAINTRPELRLNFDKKGKRQRSVGSFVSGSIIEGSKLFLCPRIPDACRRYECTDPNYTHICPSGCSYSITCGGLFQMDFGKRQFD